MEAEHAETISTKRTATGNTVAAAVQMILLQFSDKTREQMSRVVAGGVGE
jgi:hypothetical protein